MLYAAIILFGVTTLMGLYLSSLVFKNREKPVSVIIIHGILSLMGFAILLFYYPASLTSLALLGTATLFGLMLLYQHLTQKKYTKWYCLAHGILTIAGLLFVIELALLN